MAIVIERTITVKNDKSSLDNPLYLYIGDGDITCLFTIKEIKKAATFGAINQTNLITESASYGEIRIYKPTDELAFTTRAEIIDDKLQALFSYEHIDQLTESGTHQLQIHLYDDESEERNRFTIPPVEISVLLPIGFTISSADYAAVDQAKAAAEGPIDTFLEDGSYNKTEWKSGDNITSSKLNKIEDAIYMINSADEDYVTAAEMEAELANKANKSDMPTKTSQLVNDSGFITESIDLSAYATRRELNELEEAIQYVSDETDTKANKSDIPTKTSDLDNDSNFITSIPSEYITETELNNKNYANKDYVTSAINNAQLSGGNDGSDIDLSIYATKDDLNNKADISDIPTKVSQLENDKGYITSADLPTIPSEYITDTELSAKNYADKDYVTSAISDAQLNGNNVDLSDYATKEDLNLGLNTKAQASHTHNEYALKSSIPTVPTKVSQLPNDSGYITGNFFRIEVVDELPVSEVTGVLYIVKKK